MTLDVKKTNTHRLAFKYFTMQ